jgi:outer membrane protein
MKSKFMRFSPAAAALFALSALAQTSSAATPPNAPGAGPATPETTSPAPSTGTKVGTINIQEAIFGSNEGRKEIEGLQKKYEPKNNELKGQNDELDALKKQLNTQQDKLSADALDNLKKQIETKQKTFDRAYQDFQEEVNNDQQEIAKKILQKLAPIVVKYSQSNGFGVIVDTSKPWPESPVLWWGEAVDITKPVVEAYNVQSGVPAPAAPGAAPKPATPKPSSTAPSSPKPQGSSSSQ